MYESISACRSCGSDDLMRVIDLGMQYLSDFREDASQPPQAPLTLMMCEKCALVQLAHTVNRSALYHDNYGFRSGVNEGIVKDLRSIVYCAMAYVRKGKWLDIAANDGTLLEFVPSSFHRVGIDPVEKFQDEGAACADEWICDYFSAKAVNDEQFDVITSISMFYDIDKLDQFVGEVASVLSDQGVWIIQQNYLYEMLRLGAIDNVCHEHLTYFDLQTLHALLWRHGLIITDAKVSSVNGGVLRTVVRKVGGMNWHVNRSVERVFKREKAAGIGQPEVMLGFVDKVRRNLDKLIEVVDDSNNQPIDIYGASTRGAVLWQAAGIDSTRVSFAVERQQEKVGKWFSPLGVQIISEEMMRQTPPVSLLVGPWWHRNAFIEREQDFLKDGGKMIFPLPEVEVVDGWQ